MSAAYIAAFGAPTASSDERLRAVTAAVSTPEPSPNVIRAYAALLAGIGRIALHLLTNVFGSSRPVGHLQFMHAAVAEGLYAPGFYLAPEERVADVSVITPSAIDSDVVEAWRQKGFGVIVRPAARIPISTLPALFRAVFKLVSHIGRLAASNARVAYFASDLLGDGARLNLIGIWATTKAKEWVTYFTYDRCQAAAIAWAPFLGYRVTSYQYSAAPHMSNNAGAAFVPVDRLLAWSRASLGHHASSHLIREIHETGCWLADDSAVPTLPWPGRGTGRRILFFDNVYVPENHNSAARTYLEFLEAALAIATIPGHSIVFKSKYRNPAEAAAMLPRALHSRAEKLWKRIFDHRSITVLARLDVHPYALCKSADVIGVLDFITASAIAMLSGKPTEILCTLQTTNCEFPQASLFADWIHTDSDSLVKALSASEPANGSSDQAARARMIFSLPHGVRPMDLLRHELCKVMPFVTTPELEKVADALQKELELQWR